MTDDAEISSSSTIADQLSIARVDSAQSFDLQ